ncbi:MAG: hypothetical protein HYZ79_04830 [Candidatus Melainabacteria bacterium]|nr:hypothetical protein [Candidatus Melainabacteria bacterium]
MELLITQIIFLLLLGIFLLYVSRKQNLFTRLMHFLFPQRSSMLSLAIFRIILFCALILVSFKGFNNSYWLSSLPDELIYDSGYFTNLFPVNSKLVLVAKQLFIFFCFTSMIGFFTRPSMILASLLGLYVLGIPQLYGKSYHIHHLLWCSFILSTARCGDLLSIDSLILINKSKIKSYAPEMYSMPIRFIWLILGLIYFFPGFWKLWSCGVDWFLGDNLNFILYDRWARLNDFAPLFRIDHYPFFLQFGGLLVILFEISFIFAIFSDKYRKYWLIMGLIFHSVTYVFMKISFWYLLVLYFAFVDWENILKRRINYARSTGITNEHNVDKLINQFDPSRWDVLLRRIAKEHSKREKQKSCRALAKVIYFSNPNKYEGKTLQFNRVIINLNPESDIASRKLEKIYQLTLSTNLN